MTMRIIGTYLFSHNLGIQIRNQCLLLLWMIFAMLYIIGGFISALLLTAAVSLTHKYTIYIFSISKKFEIRQIIFFFRVDYLKLQKLLEMLYAMPRRMETI